jgi:hypothetical protein
LEAWLTPFGVRALAIDELFADGVASRAELDAACLDAGTFSEQSVEVGQAVAGATAYREVCDAQTGQLQRQLVIGLAGGLASALADTVSPMSRADWDDDCSPAYDAWSAAKKAEAKAQAALLRELFDNPFRPVWFQPAWRSPAAVAIAQGMYSDRCFDDMPILADALEEAGCTDPAILAHCDELGTHARGCWLLDSILNKE